ncbi:MAG: hypothetical protein D6681_15090 [Calditrichaeota bacterium]|nr:MAG: hypothetical protein D6681_15090 [Calditrichota bacterium]
MPFSQLLEWCCTPDSPHYQRAWNEFYRRYNLLMLKAITKRCAQLNVPRLKLQFDEVVHDIFGDVLTTLVQDNCRVLRDFRAKDNEGMFKCWLAIICNKRVWRFVNKHLPPRMVNTETEHQEFIFESPRFRQHLTEADQWELYEWVVACLRGRESAPGTERARQRGNLERDIHIYLLYVWGDFNQEMISSLPHLDIGHRVTDNVVNRMRERVRGCIE